VCFCINSLYVCLSVCRCLRAAVAACGAKNTTFTRSSSFTKQKAGRACDLRWFRPPLVDLTTENDSRIERIVRYDQDSDGDKMIKIEKIMRPQLTTLV